MNRLTRLIIPLILAQFFSLALGLWLQDRFLISFASWQAKSEMADEFSEEEIKLQVAPQEVSGELLAKNLMESMLPVRLLAMVWIVGLQSIAAYLIITRANTEHVRQQQLRKEHSLNQSRELTQTRDAVVFGLAKLAESRDPETGQHLERIAMYSTRLSTCLRNDPIYHDSITSSFIKLIGISSALHDIGKVGVADSILLKPGDLTPEERSQIQLHTTIGGDCIREIERRLGNSNFLEMAREIAYFHHERWDGTGYPYGLKGEEIPLSARIVSIADVYDALRTRRIYKPAFSHKKCVEIISSGAGKQFDPHLVKVFLKIAEQFRSISIRFSDTELEAETAKEAKEHSLQNHKIAIIEGLDETQQLVDELIH
jgi:response regulator RpfG family c-di-GMP phosphodiesterase